MLSFFGRQILPQLTLPFMNTLNSFVSAMVAISIAAERLVAILKSFMPWLAKEATLGTGEVDLHGDMLRRIFVFSIAFFASWITAAFLVTPNEFHFCGFVQLPGFRLPASVIGVLGSGVSALWSSLLNYSSALKDIKIQARDTAQGATQIAAPAASTFTASLTKGSKRNTTA